MDILTVYWLGVHFPGAAGLPPLLLGKVEGPMEGSYHRFTLSYMPPDDPFGSAVVTLQEWPRANWETNSGSETPQELAGPCWHREDLALPHGRAQLFLGFASAGRAKPCPRRPYTLYIAHVPVALWGALAAAGLYTDMHEHRYLFEYIPVELQLAPIAILYPLVVLSALASLVVPHLRRRYAGGLWTAVLLNPIILLVVWWAAVMLYVSD